MIRRNPIWQPWFLAVLLAVGFGIVWGGAVFWCAMFVDQVGQADRIYRTIEVLHDGTPLIRSHSFSDHYYLGFTYETLDGETVVPSKRDAFVPGTVLSCESRRRGPWGDLAWPQRVQLFMDTKDKPIVYWYLIHDGKLNGRSYFVGYDCRSRLCVGYIGRAGFRLTKPSQDDCFPVDGSRARRGGGHMVGGLDYHWRDRDHVSDSGPAGRVARWTVYLISGDQLLKVDLHERTVRVLLESTGLRTVSAVLPAVIDKSKEKSDDLLALRTDREILILDSDGNQRSRYVIPEQLRHQDFTFYQLGETTAMAHQDRYLGRTATRRYSITCFDGQGTVSQDRSLGLPTYSSWLARLQWTAYVIGAAVPAPVVVTPAALFVIPFTYVDSGEFPDYPSALAQVLRDSWPALVIFNLLGVGLAWVCYRRQRQYGQGWTWVWVGFVFLFGLPGLVGYLFHRNWPARPPCPKCNVPAPRDRESCFECREEFPEPAPKGTEVLV